MKHPIHTIDKFDDLLTEAWNDAHDAYAVLFTPDWDGRDYIIEDFKKVGRAWRFILRERNSFAKHPTESSYETLEKLQWLTNILCTSQNHSDDEVSFVILDSSEKYNPDRNKYFILADVHNYSIGQDEVYFNLKRIS